MYNKYIACLFVLIGRGQTERKQRISDFSNFSCTVEKATTTTAVKYYQLLCTTIIASNAYLQLLYILCYIISLNNYI